MSGLEVVGAVAAVLSAFHGGAELVTQIKKKNKKRKGEQAYKEKQLQESLENGEMQIEKRYEADCREFGDYVKRGDVIARDRLLQISVVLQAEVIRSLQLAVRYDNAVLDLTVLHETVIMNRKDAITTLDEMKQRIIMTLPPLRMMSPAFNSSSFESTRSLEANMIPNNYRPPAIVIPEQHESSSRSGLGRFISHSRRSSAGRSSIQPPPSSSSSSSVNFHSGYQWLGPPIHEQTTRSPERHVNSRGDLYQDINETLSSFQDLQIDNTRQETLGQLQGGFPQAPRQSPPAPHLDPADLSNHPAFASQRNNNRNYAFSPPSLNRVPSNSSISVYSEHRPASPRGSTMGATSSQPLNTQNIVTRNDSISNRSANSDGAPASVNSRSSNASAGTTGSGSAFSPRTSSNSALGTPTTPLTPDATSTQLAYSLFPQVPRNNKSTPPPMMGLPPPQPPPNRALPPIPTPPPPPALPVAAPPSPKAPLSLKPIAPLSPSTSAPLSPSISVPLSPTPTAPLSPGTLSVASNSFNHTRNVNTFSTFSAESTPSTVPSYDSSNRPSVFSNLTRASTVSSNSGSTTSTTTQATQMMTGRPCKSNNYWGFCKGAWAVREDLKKGLSVQTRPEGLYNTVSVWQCKHCLFQGDTFQVPIPGKKKKETIIDPSVHTSAVGIKYRFIFLAKSHVKRKSSAVMAGSSKDSDCNYGCLFCSAEGKSTSVFGSVQTLMNHVFSTHAQGMSEEVQRSTKCVVGREPEPGEPWDVCIPFKRFLGDGTAARG